LLILYWVKEKEPEDEKLSGRIFIRPSFTPLLSFTHAKILFNLGWTIRLVQKHWNIVLQPLRWRCVVCVIHHHHERDVREEQHHIYVTRTSNNRVIMACDFYCCLLPQCEALRTCRKSFPTATVVLGRCNNVFSARLCSSGSSERKLRYLLLCVVFPTIALSSADRPLHNSFLTFFYLSTPFGHAQALQHPYHWLTPGYYKDKVKTNVFLLPLTTTYVTFPSTPWNWFQHPLEVLAPQVKKPWNRTTENAV